MPDSHLNALLVAGMQDMLAADRRLLKAFPRLAKAARHKDVRRLCREGVSYTEERIARLERALRLLGARSRARNAPAMVGLIEEAMEAVHDSEYGACDAGILASVQAISHYGRSGYWTLCAYAEALGERKAKTILMKSLKEKEEAIGEERHMAESDIIPRLAREPKAHADAAGAKHAPRKRARRNGPRARRSKAA
jgi:ferritin-like metal-binding protein YciE